MFLSFIVDRVVFNFMTRFIYGLFSLNASVLNWSVNNLKIERAHALTKS